jgi:superfamily I DNA and RNA helicase
MVKLISEAHVQSDHLEWRAWDEKRTTPFVAEGVRGEAWVKVLSRDLDTGAESLLYKLDTVVEDSFVLKHDYFSAEDNEELFLSSYPRETEAVKAVRDGRDPKLPKRW